MAPRGSAGEGYGSHGYGYATGFSCSVPMFNPTDLVDAIFAHLDGREPEPLVPWFRDWTGSVTPDSTRRDLQLIQLLEEVVDLFLQLRISEL